MSMRLLCIGAAVCCAAAGGQAAQADDERAERARITAERSQVERMFDAREEDCRTRFAVNACVDAANRERREALGRLRQQEMLLDEARRKERAAERMQSIRGKVSRDDARRRRDTERRTSRAASAPAAPTPRASGARAESTMPERAARKQRPAETAAARAEAARKTAAYEKRQAEARAHREAVERRNAERAAEGKMARPLPVPASAPGG